MQKTERMIDIFSEMFLEIEPIAEKYFKQIKKEFNEDECLPLEITKDLKGYWAYFIKQNESENLKNSKTGKKDE